jgi:hypothetical protein
VEDNEGAGGIWRGVWLLGVTPMNEKYSVVKDGGFERAPVAWHKSVMCGEFAFELDEENAHSGAACAELSCIKVGTADDEQKFRTRAWARWYQTGVPVEKGRPYRLRLWAKTSSDFAGTVAVWVTGDAKRGTVATNLANTEDRWYPVAATNIVPAGETVAIYLNARDGTGTVWFDDVELVPEHEASH